jgi:hypothetical protein
MMMIVIIVKSLREEAGDKCPAAMYMSVIIIRVRRTREGQ